MGSSGIPDATPADIRHHFRRTDTPCTPVTADEVATALECSNEAARSVLTELVERGELHTKQLGSERVWWRTDGSGAADQESDRQQFSAFIDAVEDYAIFMLDPDGAVRSWNAGAERIKGYAEAEIVGEHFSTFYTDEDVADGIPERNLEAAAAEGRTEDEGWRVRQDGSRFWADVTITAIHDEDGTLQGFTKVTRDMTERQEYEQQLRKERDLTEQILETVPVSICLLDSDGGFVRANQRMLDRTGIDADNLTEHTIGSWEIYDEEGEPIPVEEWPWSRIRETGSRCTGSSVRSSSPSSAAGGSP